MPAWVSAVRVVFLDQQLGDAEVEQLEPALAGDQHVGGLEVAMDHELAVRVLDGAARVLEEAQALLDGELRARRSTSVSGSPSTYSMAKYGCPSSVTPPSSRRATLTCSSPARICRSRRKRRRMASLSMPRLISLMTTRCSNPPSARSAR